MKISIIIPTIKGREEMLKEALDSVYNQTVLPYEIILFKGGKNNKGKINNKIAGSKCDAFIQFCDDDKLDPTYIEKTTKKMEETKADIVGTWLENFGDETGIHGFNKMPFGTSLIKKSIWKKVGGYDEDLGVGDDSDFYTMCINNGAKIESIPEPLLKYRQHKSNWSKSGDWKESNKKRQEKYKRLEYKYNPFN